MMSALLARAQVTAERAAARARERVARSLRAQVPGVRITIEEDRVVLSGRITRDDPRLRWIGSLLR